MLKVFAKDYADGAEKILYTRYVKGDKRRKALVKEERSKLKEELKKNTEEYDQGMNGEGSCW